MSLAVFATFFLSTPYLAAFIQFPGPTSLSALSDRFLFISPRCLSPLAALMVWDALELETRDVAILGPLPIARPEPSSARSWRYPLRRCAGCLERNPQRPLSGLSHLNMRGMRAADFYG